ncbi:hypothetical protein BLA24_25825 [Streptomyces cinnamoneus]|uniref:Uncharacterized protein n=1 Tax=Streptomyces cinnamoneus TaxID=53446 RepID=A0A2G1XE27_STRCJ|nr:hypothetical protein [Streptomyces cinnamoneus]PHQ49462.1 hypothetical protein BLA24_25825 [Streptomyces cinnamoneus]PPT14888.1 hypothetical protein CYQ11_20245 [Streptomyces cinnamoneus]
MQHGLDAPSDETLATYAARLEDDCYAWPSWYTGRFSVDDLPTHVEMFTWNDDRAGWIGDKSNFEVARDAIRTAADEGREDTSVSDEHVYECGGGSSAWDTAQLFVQVYEQICPLDCLGTHTEDCKPDCDPYEDECYGAECEGDCHGRRTYTAAFHEAVALAEFVKNDHPFLDEDDYYDQRREVFEKNLDEALEDVALHYPYDTDADHQSIVEHASERLWDLSDNEPDGYADWDDVRDAYDYGRGEHFLNLGREFMRNEIPGQLALMPA